MISYDIVIIGGGPAGLAAAAAAKNSGIDRILILERDSQLGGILNQCIHNGFGLHTFKEELTGPEYAKRYIDQVFELGIEYRLNTMVLDITKEKVITAMNRTDGLFKIQAKAVVLAMGCRERARGSLNIPGCRPAGIYSAGTAQRLVNIEGFLPGRKVVILGSGDIGLIMARRMTLEGAKVQVVAELMPYSGGLKRNIVQCLDDYGIPLKLSHTVVDIRGRERVEGVTIAQVDGKGKPVPGTEEDYECDTLLLSVGLIPENELSRGIGVDMNAVTNGPSVNESLETSISGVFACGNVLHVHDLVDYVSEEASAAGKNAAKYVKNRMGSLPSGKLGIRTDAAKSLKNGLGSLPSGQPDAGKDAAKPAEDSLGSLPSGQPGIRTNVAKFAEDSLGNLPSGQPGIETSTAKYAANGSAGEAENAAPLIPAGEFKKEIPLIPAGGVRYTVPNTLCVSRMEDVLTVRFRVGAVYRNCFLAAYLNDQRILHRKRPIMAPGEMEEIKLKKADLEAFKNLEHITVKIEEA